MSGCRVRGYNYRVIGLGASGPRSRVTVDAFIYTTPLRSIHSLVSRLSL